MVQLEISITSNGVTMKIKRELEPCEIQSELNKVAKLIQSTLDCNTPTDADTEAA